MNIKTAVAVALAAVLFTVGVVAREPDTVLIQGVPEAQGPAVGAQAAIVMEATSGRILFEQDIHKQLPIASTTKIMTALLALEQTDIDSVFEVNAEAIRVEGSSMGLQEGDQASLRALATGMLLASGNDGANAAAVRISGSLPAFAEKMNQRAAEIGMENTSFETPSGLDGEHHYSTAYDMALLAREALNNPDFAAICSQYKMRASYGNPPYDRWLTNHNKLLNYYEGTIGLKTGFTKKAGRCLVSAAQRDGITLIVVTLDCPNDWTVHETLYNRFFDDMAVRDLAQGIPQILVPVTGGTEGAVQAMYYDTANYPVPAAGADIQYKIYAPHFLYAPVLSGQYVGEVEILVDGEKVATLTLITRNEVPLLNEYREETGLLDWLFD